MLRLLAVLVLFAGICGCKSISHPPEKPREEQSQGPSVPNGEASPFTSSVYAN
jgi:hypothetical protein